MKLSAPIHVLKSNAKKLKREKDISLNEALNEIAKKEGFSSWSLLASKSSTLPENYEDILDYLNGGDLFLVGGRPGHCKTQFCIGLLVQALSKNLFTYYYTLEDHHKNLARRIAFFDETIGQDLDKFELHYSDNICSEYIINHSKERPGSLIIIDYLQILDQKRSNPELEIQLKELKEFAKQTNSIIIFISQVDRKVENRFDNRPTIEDIRMPNPFDTSLFNKISFLYKRPPGLIDVNFMRPKEFSFQMKHSTLFKYDIN